MLIRICWTHSWWQLCKWFCWVVWFQYWSYMRQLLILELAPYCWKLLRQCRQFSRCCWCCCILAAGFGDVTPWMECSLTLIKQDDSEVWSYNCWFSGCDPCCCFFSLKCWTTWWRTLVSQTTDWSWLLRIVDENCCVETYGRRWSPASMLHVVLQVALAPCPCCR